MLKFDIVDKFGNKKVKLCGNKIEYKIDCNLVEGDVLRIFLDGSNYVFLKLDESAKESLIYLPNKALYYKVPNKRQIENCFNSQTFLKLGSKITVREPMDEEVYSYRNLALNSSDMPLIKNAYPHASANFVTREEPCFYARNAIDGVKNNQGHGKYPYHSWAGGARNDLEFTLDFGQNVEVDKFIIYLRADFKHDSLGVPHDSYWKSIDAEFSNGNVVNCQISLLADNLHSENEKGVEIIFEKQVTSKVILKNFKQATQKLGFAALTQIEVYGKIIKENLNIMEVRQASNAKDVKHYTTERLREEFHIANLFTKDNTRMVYSHIDRIITAGIMPVKQTIYLTAGEELKANYFLERREMGCINVGGKGVITVDGKEYEMNARDGIYIGKGNKEVSFKSVDELNPAKFYISSCPAHTEYPTVKIDITKAKKVPCGSVEECNKRVINQYIHPEVIKSCQLAMGLTQIQSGSNWNTMPCHTHDRRMEVYMYLDMGEDDIVFHMMGEPTETRHIVMKNEEAVISPSWSIHSGVGTKNYSFIWAMCGENQEFTDMDHIQNRDLL